MFRYRPGLPVHCPEIRNIPRLIVIICWSKTRMRLQIVANIYEGKGISLMIADNRQVPVPLAALSEAGELDDNAMVVVFERATQ